MRYVLAIFVLFATCARSADWYASPDGDLLTGDGSIENPYHLQVALSGAVSAAAPGDTVWLRGGRYRGPFYSSLQGTSNAPIVVRPYPGETVKLDDSLTAEVAVAMDTNVNQITLNELRPWGAGDWLAVDGECMQVLSYASGTTWNVVRGWNGSPISPHSVGATVEKAGTVLYVVGSYTWFRDFEITSVRTNRTAPGWYKGGGIDLSASGVGNKAINLIIHNVGHPGIGFWDQSDGGEVYGCMIWGVGLYDTDTSQIRGSAIYAQNQVGSVGIRNNITFRNFTTGMKGYGTAVGAQGFTFDGNFCFDNQYEANLQLATVSVPIDVGTVDNNVLFIRPGHGGANLRVGFTSEGNGTAYVRNNYILGGSYVFHLRNFSNLVYTGNTSLTDLAGISDPYVMLIQAPSPFSSHPYTIDNNSYYALDDQSVFSYSGAPGTRTYAQWRSDTGYDSNSSFSSSSPNFTTAITRTNKYKPGRAHVAVVNYSGATNYVYNLADAGVSPGSGYVIRDAQNYFEPILSGVYLGGSVSLPLTLTNVSVIYGETNHIVNSHTPSTFNVFVIDSEEGELENGETESPFVPKNFVANSGAELGPTRGWFYTGPAGLLDSTGPTVTRDEWVMEGVARTGKRSWVANLLYSRPMWLTAGVYRLSFYAKMTNNAGIQGPLWSGVMSTERLGKDTPAGTQNITTNWVRYTNTFTASTNGFYHVAFRHLQPYVFVVDDIQLEAGTVVTEYAPKTQVEIGVDTEVPGGVFLSGSGKGRFRVRAHNSGSTFADVRVIYQIHDLWNALQDEGEFRLGVKPGGTTTQYIPFDGLGWRRCTVRIAGVPDSTDEASASLLPWAESDLPLTTRVGTHPQTAQQSLDRYWRNGFNEFRSLSPGSAFTRWNTLEPSADNWLWTQADIEAARVVNAGWTVLGVLTPGVDGAWSPWATNSDGSPSLERWTNYVGTLVARYGSRGLDYIHTWEVLNEPDKFTTTWGIATNYVTLLTESVKAIKDADPDAQIIAMGGVSDYTWARTVWDSLSPETKGNITAVSCHYYPTVPQPNVSDFNHFWKNWRLAFEGDIPVWFTESGVWQAPSDTTLNTIWPYQYDLWGTPEFEAHRGERTDRLPFHTERWMYTLFRALGNGMHRVYYYDSRNFGEDGLRTIATQNSMEDHKDEHKPVAITSAVAGYILGDALGLGQLTNNAAGPGLEAYLFNNGTVVAWSDDRTPRTLTVTNGSFGVVDLFGNEIQTNLTTASITRTPVFLLTSTMTTNAMRLNIANAAVSTADVRPPRVRVTIAPTAEWDGGELGLLRWVAQSPDLYNYPDASAASNILSRFRLNGGEWSTFSPANHAWITNSVTSGDNTVEIEAKIDGVGTGTASWRFSPPRVSEPATFTISGRISAGSVSVE